MRERSGDVGEEIEAWDELNSVTNLLVMPMTEILTNYKNRSLKLNSENLIFFIKALFSDSDRRRNVIQNILDTGDQ